MKVLIVGNNVSGITAARRIREFSADAGISVLSSEPYPYYTRPKLIDLIAGTCGENDLFFYKPDWYIKNQIDVKTSTTVNSIDIKNKKAITNTDEILYDKLILATGAQSFVPPSCRTSLQNVFTLRTIKDALAINSAAKNATKATIIGGGVLGLEIAHAIKRVNPKLEITVLEVFDRLLPRQLDAEGSAILNNILSNGGIKTKTNVKILGTDGFETVSSVTLENEKIETDMVCISAGVKPDLSLCAGTDIAVNKGIIINNFLQTSVPDIFAIGDCAEYSGTVYGIIKPAMDMASILALNLVSGKTETEYKGSPISKTFKLLDFYLTALGTIDPEDTTSFDIIRAKTNDEYRKYIISKTDGHLSGYIAIAKKQQETKALKALISGMDLSSKKEKMRDMAFEF